MQIAARLTNLLELADKGPALRAALAEEVVELLIDWPGDCPQEMRGACEALLASAAREVDEETQARLRTRLKVDPDLAARVLPHSSDAGRYLIETARGGGDIANSLAEALDLSRARAAEILSDSSGHALAIACRALGLSRAAFSALVLLQGLKGHVTQYYARLDVFDTADASEAAKCLADWRAHDNIQHAA